MPSAALQQKALELVAVKFNDPETMDRHAGLDRLLYLVCTGGGNAQTYQEKMGTSQAALTVLRNTLNGERIYELLLHTLAPPPQEEEGSPPGPTVVQKLWNTVVENLTLSTENDDQKETRSLFLSGALGGLALMLFDEQSREMMSRVAPEAANADIMLEALQTEEDKVVQWIVLRFLCEWIMDTPLMVQKLLSSTASLLLVPMAASFDKEFTPLVHLLLGLAMEYLRCDEKECGGWTRAGILQVIQKVGISKFTSSLEGFKKVQNAGLPCFLCTLEYNHWTKWYNQAVWVVRKRIVEELAGGGSLSDDSDTEIDTGAESKNTSATPGPGGVKPLQKLIVQQSKEIDILRQDLERANVKINSQEHQLDTWKRRMESSPTELDSMLSEMTNKTASFEETISKLEAEAKHAKAQYESELNSLNIKLSEARQQADESRTSEHEARDDRERMEQELSALSQAYASLEEEYQREEVANSNSTATAGDPTSEGRPQEQQQPEGEVSHQEASTGSTEISTLRAENTRLRNDALAADQWMKMAVNRMNEMGTQINPLKHQVVTLTNQIETVQRQAKSEREQQVEKLNTEQQGREEELREQISLLESQLSEERSLRKSAAANASSSLHSQEVREIEWRQQISQLESQLGEARMLQESAAVDMSNVEVQLERERHNAREIEQHLAKAREEARIVIEENKVLEQNLAQETARANSIILQTSESRADAQTPASSHQSSTPVDLNNENVSGQIDAARDDMERSKNRLEEEIYKKESIIRELEDRLGSALGPFTVEDIRARDAEIEELRAANEAAQDWMSKAVELHQSLSTQVTALSEEKAAISAKLESMENEITTSSLNDDKINQLGNEIKQKTQLIEEIKEELAKREGELAKSKADREEQSGIEQDLGITRDDMVILQSRFLQAQENMVILQNRFSEAQQDIKTLKQKLSVKALDNENEKNEIILQLRQELKIAQSALERDEDVVHQWEGMHSKIIVLFVCLSLNALSVVSCLL
jgi:hypothetical protein